jgi:hypothetical protein
MRRPGALALMNVSARMKVWGIGQQTLAVRPARGPRRAVKVEHVERRGVCVGDEAFHVLAVVQLAEPVHGRDVALLLVCQRSAIDVSMKRVELDLRRWLGHQPSQASYLQLAPVDQRRRAKKGER